MKLFTVLFLCASVVAGSRILLSAPFGSKSHQNMYIPLIGELAKRGHHVTFITNYESSELKKLSNVRQFVFPQLAIDMNKMPNSFNLLLSQDLINFEAITFVINIFWTMTKETVEAVYSHQDIKKMMSNETFDLVMASAFSPASLPFAWHFKAPLIQISPAGLFTGMASLLGDDENYSYVPFLMTSFSDKMNLKERTINFVTSRFFGFMMDLQKSMLLPIAREKFFPNLPPFDDIERESTALILINSHPTFVYPRTLAPQIIEVGGPHCRPPKPLDAELEEFVSGSEAGFIVFGVGSYQRMDDMPEKLIQPFIKAFSRIPQRVVWQWKGKPRADFPKNVLAMPWLPQQDLLGHKKCRLFMTHGGLNGLQETIYHGVPILGLPLGADQTLNIMRAARDGYGLKLDWKDVTEETLNEALQSLLHNPSYTKSVKELSALFRDQIQPPLERAVYWTEFVLRHNGTDHLILGSKDLHPLQRSLVDVYLILFLVGLTPLLMTIFCVRMCCCRRRPASKPKTALKPEAKGTGKGPTKADQKKRQ